MEQLLQCKDNLIKILYFHHRTFAFQRDIVTYILLAFVVSRVADGLTCDLCWTCLITFFGYMSNFCNPSL